MLLIKTSIVTNLGLQDMIQQWGRFYLLYKKKSRIRETKHLLTNADSSTNTTVGWTKNSQKPKFVEKTSRDMPKLANYPSTRGLSSIGKHGLNMFCTAKSAILDHFQTKCSNPRQLLSITFPQVFRISKIFGHPTLGSGGKKTFKRYLKSEQTETHGQTHGHFDL